jgi:hypothetical protein
MVAPHPPDEKLYEEYLRWQSLGVKAKATAALRAFLDSFHDLAAKAAWTDANLEGLKSNRHARIRHELFEEVIFPVLLIRFQAAEPEAMYLLAQFRHNLYSASHLHRQIGSLGAEDLLRSANAKAPGEDRYRRGLLKALLEHFGYLDHEWPAGILVDVRDPSSWHALLEDIRLARDLDHAGEKADRLDQFEARVLAYESRILAALPDEPRWRTEPIT